MQTYLDWSEWAQSDPEATRAVDALQGESFLGSMIIPAAGLIRGVVED